MSITARNMAKKILKDTGCTEETYQGIGIDVILSDLKSGFPDGIPGKFDYDEIAESIYAISTTERGWKEPIQYEFDGVYASHCGATDLYEPINVSLKKLIDSGEPFKADNLSSKKELVSWSMQRELVEGTINLKVIQWMDEGKDLVQDALPDGVELSDEQIDEILNVYILGCDGDFTTSESAVLPGDSSLDDVLKKVNELCNETDKTLKEWFKLMQGTVHDYLTKKRS